MPDAVDRRRFVALAGLAAGTAAATTAAGVLAADRQAAPPAAAPGPLLNPVPNIPQTFGDAMGAMSDGLRLVRRGLPAATTPEALLALGGPALAIVRAITDAIDRAARIPIANSAAAKYGDRTQDFTRDMRIMLNESAVMALGLHRHLLRGDKARAEAALTRLLAFEGKGHGAFTG
ncbi:MAG: hypothetical protein AB8G96_00070 [Phycisphaerales bacterium]